MTPNPAFPLALAGLGMTTPVGLTAAQTARSIRAGVARVEETPFMDHRMQPILAAFLDEAVLPPLEDHLVAEKYWSGLHQRMLRLAADPLAEAGKKAEGCPVFLALPDPLPQRDFPLPGTFLERLSALAGLPIPLDHSRLFPLGRAGLFQALQEAAQTLARGESEAVLVGAVDTFHDPQVLAHYDQREKRLLQPDATDGFHPGEGAAFLLLANPSTCRAKGWEPLALLQGVGIGTEEGHLYSAAPYRGDGLAAAFQALFEAVPPTPIQTVLAGFNGEHVWAKEWGVSFIRHRSRFAEDHRIEHPAQNLGDAGAALPAILLGCAALDLQRGRTQGPVLAFAGSDLGLRGAALLAPVC